jgi:alpha-ketoglutarate-dependent taurine dioxygenase
MPALDSPAVSTRRPISTVIERLDGKLDQFRKSAAGSVVELDSPGCLTHSEQRELLRALNEFNFVIYQVRPGYMDKTGLKALGKQLGIDRTDHNFCADGNDISSLQVCEQGTRTGYIPYSDRPLGWHTDGYYYGSQSGRAIRSFILHCVTPAPTGGKNSLLDPDIVVLLLSQIDASLPGILSSPSTFAIPRDANQPANTQSERTGPVFSIDPISAKLHMRYTARRHNIRWNPDPNIMEAVRCLKEVIENAAAYTVTHKLESGQGIICNNVLHRRTGFLNGSSISAQRLMYRARYYDRVPATLAGRTCRPDS